MKILELKKVNKRIHQPKKKSLIIQTYGIRHYMKKLFNSGNSQDKPSLQQSVSVQPGGIKGEGGGKGASQLERDQCVVAFCKLYVFLSK